MKWIKLLVIFLLVGATTLGGIALTRAKSSTPIDDCENVFASNVYRDYYQQLQTFVYQHPLYETVKEAPPTAFNSEVQKLIEQLKQPLGHPQEQRSVHESWVKQFRHLITSFNQLLKGREEESFQFVQDLTRWVFLQAHTREAIQQFFYGYKEPPKEDLFVYLTAMQSALREDPQFFGMQFDVDQEDNFLHGNLPSFLFSLPAPIETKVIRLANPLDSFSNYPWPWSAPNVHPEFLFFLKSQPSHLYVNLMKRKGVEASASYTLEQLEKQIPNLYVVTLDKSSPFYWQEAKSYPDGIEIEAFKNIFLGQMMAKKGNYFWSQYLTPDVWKAELRFLMQAVHQNYFRNSSVLSRNERQDFIELTYLAILDRLVEKWQPASMNISCRQSMDRGPSLAILWMWKHHQVESQEVPALLFAPPLLIHNRPSHTARIERFVSAAKRLPISQHD